MLPITDRQAMVIKMAKDILKSDHGIKVICLDYLATDEEIIRDGVEECAMTLVVDTGYWEGAFA